MVSGCQAAHCVSPGLFPLPGYASLESDVLGNQPASFGKGVTKKGHETQVGYLVGTLLHSEGAHRKGQQCTSLGAYPTATFRPPMPTRPGPRLAPFLRLPGRVIRGPATVQVELRPESVRQLNRDLAEVCARVNQLQPALPDGRRLVLSVDRMTPPGPEAHRQQACDHLR
jgi:hypothetical protein